MDPSGCSSAYQPGCSAGCGAPLEAACSPGGPCNGCATACGGASDPGPWAALALALGRLTPERLEAARSRHRRLPRLVGLRLIACYRCRLASRLSVECRYTPSCSGYGFRAVSRYGLWAGGRLAAARVLRCRPGVRRGTHDPVPGRRTGR
ncbi:membrane protein insertion efficiency factor YidD [Glycomyces xiaoerkulensis]|uniref:membrane protein insertion efficiency factor YidD n=1 Tax=Glycomyces xiaoerkulensis TaxID=2038139 RepID=UPI001E3ACFC3|nr:membrane protein insertion efficiency factor YidD [Glycomyces xiaoerkulensis]